MNNKEDTRSKILLLEKDDQERKSLAQHIGQETNSVVLEEKIPENVLHTITNQDISLFLIDVSSLGNKGFDLIRSVQVQQPEIVCIAAVPYNDRESITSALKAGAQFYFHKPYDLSEVSLIVSRGLKHHELLKKEAQNKPKLRQSDGFCGIVGNSPIMLDLFEMIEKIAYNSSGTVLVQGESGTGKELVARAIHYLGPRQNKNFVPVNCAAIPDELLESELFGYEKGAFTGANQSKKGRLHYADGGTLFLDEIGDMKPTLQGKLLRVMQDQEFEPVGAVKPVKVDTMVVAATNCDLEKAVKEGKFRQDLYFRLSVIPLWIPPLRERKEDIPSLVEKFILAYNREKKHGIKRFTSEALEALKQYSWPGNVRELENLVQRLSILHTGEVVDVFDLPDKYLNQEKEEDNREEDLYTYNSKGKIDFNSRVSEFENRLILQALIETRGNKKKAASRLNLKRTTLLEKIKKKNLDNVFESLYKNKNSA